MFNKKYYLRKGLALACGMQVGKREFTPDAESVALVSYPKSGNTWLRSLLACLISKKDLSLKEIEDVVPDIYKKRLNWLNNKKPKIFKSHEVYHPNYKKVIYITRDPRDVAVSYFSYQKSVGQIKSDMSMDDYVDLYLSGLHSTYGCWSNHVASWYVSNSKNVKIISYENLKENPFETLKSICKFLDLDAPADEIENVLNNNTLVKMKNKSDGWNEGIKHGDTKQFFRSGKKNGYLKELTEEQITKINNKMSLSMKLLGYE